MDAGRDQGTTLTAGLAAQQVANGPGGDRWARLVPQIVAMYLSHVAPHLLERQRS